MGEELAQPQGGPPGASAGPESSGGVTGPWPSTHWSAVLNAGGADAGRAAEAALSRLCEVYWYPVYGFLRRRGQTHEDARDLTQEFFARLIEKPWFEGLHPSKGRFRSFLLAALKHLLANEWKRAHRQKRGGDAPRFSLDDEEACARYRLDAVDTTSPEVLFERHWAEALLAGVLRRLSAECADHPMGFANLQSFLIEPRGTTPFAEVAARIGVTESALKSGVYRLRRRYAEILREEIGHTLGPGENVEAELEYLFSVMNQ